MLNILFLILILLIIVILWVMLYDSSRVVVVSHEIRDRRICGNYRVVFLSDLHNKQFGKNNAQLLQAIEELRPDAVLI
ncbi:MAG: metallophosphoesterase, partial [Acetatifactor sp.]|nr:metallophosphoesterase [Acetatifactor sp.]